jgi:ribosomal protein S1
VEFAQPDSIADLEPKMPLQGVVKETYLYGALVDIGLERDGLVHISQLAPKHTNRVTDVVQPGDKVTVWITKVDQEQGRIGLTMIKPPEIEWHELAEEQPYTGTVTRIERYGVFVDIGAQRPGLLHIREMSTGYIRHPSDIVSIGDTIQVHILKLNQRKKQIDLGMVGLEDQVEPVLPEEEKEIKPAKTAMEIALQRARTEQQGQTRRPKKRRSPDLLERERILARTLEQHSQQ